MCRNNTFDLIISAPVTLRVATCDELRVTSYKHVHGCRGCVAAPTAGMYRKSYAGYERVDSVAGSSSLFIMTKKLLISGRITGA